MKRIRRGDASRGSAMIVVLSVLTPMLVVTGSILVVLVSHQREIEARVGQATARTLSSAGAHHALALLEVQPAFSGSYEVAIPGGAVQVTIGNWGTDGLDNDGNGLVDDAAEEDIRTIASQGCVNPEYVIGANPFDEIASAASYAPQDLYTYNSISYDPYAYKSPAYTTAPVEGETEPSTPYELSKTQRLSYSWSERIAAQQFRSTSEVTVQITPVDLAVEQAIYIDDPLANFDIDGNAFLFSGLDVNLLDHLANPDGEDKPAIGTPGDPAVLKSQVRSAQEDNIEGVNGSLSIETVAEVDLDALVEAMRSQAGQVLPLSSSITGQDTLGTVASPEITYAKGDLKISGGTSGCGILIVDGDLTIGGAFDFTGLIIANQSVTISGGGNVKNITGGLLCLGSVDAAVSLTFDFNGNLEILYSSEAIDYVRTSPALNGGLTVISWVAGL